MVPVEISFPANIRLSIFGFEKFSLSNISRMVVIRINCLLLKTCWVCMQKESDFFFFFRIKSIVFFQKRRGLGKEMTKLCPYMHLLALTVIIIYIKKQKTRSMKWFMMSIF